MADVLYLLRRRRNLRRYESIPFYLKDINNPFEYSNKTFIEKFRLSKAAVMYLCDELNVICSLHHNGYSLEFQVLSMLQLMGTGSYQRVIGDSINSKTSQPTISRSFHRLLNGLLLLRRKFLKFPNNLELGNTKIEFFNKYQFPNIVGIIDCSHIMIQKPSVRDWFVYLNRKNRYSINIQMVCDANCKIIDVVARWPGSTHDAHIWRLSGLRNLFQNSIPHHNFLIGDSGYPLENCLLVPYLNPTGPHEVIFNRKLVRCRNVIERVFGILKSRFRILDDTSGNLQYGPQTVCKIVISAAILHNICMKFKVETPEYTPAEYNGDEEICNDISPQNAVEIRNRIALEFQAQR